MTENMKQLADAMDNLSLVDYADTPSTWSQDRYHFNEGARAAARLLRRTLEAQERHEEDARAKRLARYFGVGAA
jgi:hypothetical protein